MLHEVLLALSGHPSPLFHESIEGKGPDNDQVLRHEFPLLSISEKALLQSLGELSELHRKLRRYLDEIAGAHASTICRAVANSIRHTHLGRFQKKIIDVESKILTRDSAVVGAYDIVPLSGVVSEFDDWHRRMAWYWEIVTFMQPSDTRNGSASCASGGGLIDRLRAESQTGFPDVEEAAIELSRVAETAWLRQLASWLLCGKLPAFGAADFFVQASVDSEGNGSFIKAKDLLPKFVSPGTASSILFIGKLLHQVKQHARRNGDALGLRSLALSESQLASKHLQHLASLALPLQAAQLARAVSSICLSLSQNVLQHLLPMEFILTLLACLRRYFLLNRGEFATALVAEAEGRLEARQQSIGRLLQPDSVKALQGLSIGEVELSQALGQTWKALEARDGIDEDEVFDFAREHITLSAPKKASSRSSISDSLSAATPKLSSIAFNDLLFPSETSLTLSTPSPLDLFISKREVEVYSSVNAYLLSIRRAHFRLSDLWSRTPARRDHPAPPGPRESSSETMQHKLRDSRARARKRAVATRKLWATCSAAIFLLSETAAYFEGEIIRCSWERFEAWLKKPADTADLSEDSGTMSDLEASSKPAQHDPETLASGHRAFLAALTYTLLLTDRSYTRELRSLLGNVDSLIAYFDRLLSCQQKLDLASDHSTNSSYVEEEQRSISLELDRARKRVDSDLKSVVSRLRQLDRERIGSARYLDLSAAETGGFEPWKGGGVDRLLMKLEFGRMADEGYEII